MFLILSALLSFASFADDKIEVPKMFVDSHITVTLKNGKQYSFDGNEYMVVRRKAKRDLSLLAIKSSSNNQQHSVESKEQPQKNRIRVMGGVGPSGFSVSRSSKSVNVSSDEDILVGIGYDRLLKNNFSLGGQVLSNGTYTLGVGLDF